MDRSEPLLAMERRRAIVELAGRQGVVRVKDLADLFQVSEVTIRQDLGMLAEQGHLVRQRGGAIANTTPSLVTAFEQRAGLNLDEKRRIGLAAAQLVSSGGTIIIDAGTTAMEMAKSLDNGASLTVVTNAMNIASQVGTLRNVNVIQVGGSLS